MTSTPPEDFTAWIGRTETTEDDLSLAAARSAAATLDDDSISLHTGCPLPPLWHWFYFLPSAPQSRLGEDGHPERGGFLPPIPYPRRMFAGARLRFRQPLQLGRAAQRTGEILSVRHKSGRSGSLAFVTVRYTFAQDGATCIEEEQDIVYREPGPAVPAPVPTALPTLPPHAWSKIITPTTRLLFRFSALTFNAHRIHYDRPYATQVEGYPGLVVHGPLTAVLLAELVRAHEPRPMTGFSFRGAAPLFDLAPFRLVGVPGHDEPGSGNPHQTETSRDAETSTNVVELRAEGPDGKTALTATAEFGR